MNYKLVYSPESLADLDRIWSEVRIASCDIETTDRYIRDLRDAIKKKLRFPKSGIPLMFDGEFTGVYYIVFKEYPVFYRLNGNAMEIGRILFSRSDYMKTLFGKSPYVMDDNDDE